MSRLQAESCSRSVLFDNPVVGHTRNTHPRDVGVGRIRPDYFDFTQQGEWQSPLQYS
jgi:hypothetical protein